MIGYRITRNDLEALIETHKPGWLAQAAARTEGFRQKGSYSEKSSIWSQVKSVYMTLQGECKCAYCEQKLESIRFGKIAQDVEHFRPKGNVRSWTIPKRLKEEGIAFTSVPATGGYYLLPYDLFNYAAACKPCNSTLKKDYFPIAGSYDLTGEDPRQLRREKPLLIYPIGDFDDDPEDLIHFHGVSPQAVSKRGYKRKRALVTIEFFRLDDTIGRKNLIRERATIIVLLFPQLEKAADGTDAVKREKAQKVVDACLSSASPHSNCARSFRKVFNKDRAEAEAIFARACELLASSS